MYLFIFYNRKKMCRNVVMLIFSKISLTVKLPLHELAQGISWGMSEDAPEEFGEVSCLFLAPFG
jgi:hypothetical protein